MVRLLGKCRASIERGMGGQQAAATFVFKALVDARRSVDSQAPRSLVVATWWLLRELEVSNVRVLITHVRLTSKGAVLNLPVSKTATRGVGAERCLPCLCGTEAGSELGIIDEWACPACTLRKQLDLSLRAHGVGQHAESALDCPLFFDQPGEAFSKVETIAAWRKCEGVHPEREQDREVTGHTARRTGIQLLARTGWARWQIQFMARHTTSMVDRYIDEAWTGSTAEWARDAVRSSSSSSSKAAADENTTLMEAAREDLAGKLSAVEKRVEGPGPQMKEVKDKMEKEKKRSILTRSDKGLVHVVPSGSQRGPKALWKTPSIKSSLVWIQVP